VVLVRIERARAEGGGSARRLGKVEAACVLGPKEGGRLKGNDGRFDWAVGLGEGKSAITGGKSVLVWKGWESVSVVGDHAGREGKGILSRLTYVKGEWGLAFGVEGRGGEKLAG